MINEKAYIEFGDNILIKADKKDDSIIYIEASNEKEDSQNDTVLKKALECQVEYFLKRGVISYDHLHKSEKDPKYIIGEPLDVQFTDDRKTLVKAKLYPSNKIAQDIKSKINDKSKRVGSSVGGYITKRVKGYNKTLKKSFNFITGLIWDEVALTLKPVNSDTMGNVSFVPYAEFQKSFVCEGYNDVLLRKALEAGSGTNHATFTGGRALISESLMGSTVPTIGKDVVKNYLKMVIDGRVRTYDEVIQLTKALGHTEEVANQVAVYIIENIDRIKSLRGEK